MADKMNEFRRYLESSGLHETLHALDTETARAQPNSPFNFTFERLPGNGPVPSLANPYHSNHPRDEGAMKFDSPCIKMPIPKQSDHRAKSMFGPAPTQPFRDDHNNSDTKNNDDQFSFGEDFSDNEERAKDVDDIRRQIPNIPSFSHSDNCIRVQHLPQTNSGNSRNNNGNVFQFHNTSAFATAPQNPTNPLLAVAKNTPWEANNDFANQTQIRPRSIQSRKNSAERDNSNSSFLQDRQLTAETPVSVHFADKCLLIRH